MALPLYSRRGIAALETDRFKARSTHGICMVDAAQNAIYPKARSCHCVIRSTEFNYTLIPLA